MRKVFALLMTFLIGMSLLRIHAAADGASVSLSAADNLRAGDTVMLRVRLTGTELSTFDGEIIYDPDMLAYQYSADSLDGWKITLSVSYGRIHLLGSDQTEKNPILGESRLITLVFHVRDALAEGTSVIIRASGFSVTEQGKELRLSDAEFGAVISGAQSSDATLRGLSVRGAVLSPEFSADVTDYRVEVPYSMGILDLSYEAAPGADVTVLGENLSVGENTVRILVKAEDGSEKLYKILAVRAGNPDYTPSGDASLSEIRISSGTLSPVFRWDVTSYVIYLPYETATLSVSGTSNHASASCTSIENAVLSVGDNVLRLICTAEDGTELSYILHAVRMPAFDGTSVVFPGFPSESGDGTETGSGTGHDSASDDHARLPADSGVDETTTELQDVIGYFRSHGLLIPALFLLSIPVILAFVLLFRLIFRRRKQQHLPKHG